MKLISSSFEIWEQPSVKERGLYKQIEKAARVCYKSENNITENSCVEFVSKLIKRKHFAMLEHGTVYLKINHTNPNYYELCDKYEWNSHSKVTYDVSKDNAYITTNYRVIVENGWQDDILHYVCDPTEYHEKRVTVHFTCDIGVGREFTRHRTMSMAQESTRYCNYSKDKFDNELTFIIPNWVNTYCPNKFREGPNDIDIAWGNSLKEAEDNYFLLLKRGWSPQQARSVLPLATKSELVLTGFISDWEHFFYLRAKGTTGAPHPQAKELAEPLMQEFIKRGLIHED